MHSFVVRASDNTVEVWSGYRIQFGGAELPARHTLVKAELKKALSRLLIPAGATLAGHYATTDPTNVDTENSLFTNVRDEMPRTVTSMSFERDSGAPPVSPVPIELVRGHLHYYRYQVGGRSATWERDRTLARWDRIPRRLADDDSARPAWLALREANADGGISLSGESLNPRASFGLQLVVHATRRGPRNAISHSEAVVDGTVAAFHGDRYSEPLLCVLSPKFPMVSDERLRRALDHPVGPLFDTPAILIKGGFVQFSPDDERCIVGELRISQDSTGPLPELSGELFTIRPIRTGNV